MLLLGLRDLMPSLISVVVANLLIGGYLSAIFIGMLYFYGLIPRLTEHAGIICLLVLSFCYFNYINPNVNARILLISLFLAYYCLRIALLMMRKSIPPYLRDNLLLCIIAGLGLFFLVRASYSGFLEQAIASFMKAGTFHTIAFVVYAISGFWILISLLFLGAKRLEHDITEAKDEVRQLSGLLPICANCKKIRNDQGYWQQVESYVSDHSEAMFTHSICPDCVKELYPELKFKPE